MRVVVEVVQGRGASKRLELDAPSLEEARRLAERQGYAVLAMRAARWDAAGLFGATPSLDLAVLLEQLHDLLVAGLSVIEALGVLVPARGASPIDMLMRRLRAGERLSEAMAQEPAVPALLVALVQASELTSDLPQALSRYLAHERRVAELRHRLTAIALYPAMVLVIGTLVLFFLLLYVMPRFARIFDGMPGELPWSARAMVRWAEMLATLGSGLYIGLGALGVVVVGLAASAPARTLVLRQVLARMLRWSPLTARLRTYWLARWYRATGMLMEGGIPLLQALQLAQPLLPAVLAVGGLAVQQALHDGMSPAQGYQAGGLATVVAEHLLRSGERSGDLGAVLTRIAQFHEADVARELERAMGVLEPLLMGLIGLGVGAVVVLMYLPIFELAAALQ